LNSYDSADAPAFEEPVDYPAAETLTEPVDYPAAETPAEPFNLLKSEVYFEAPESLEDSTEEEFTRLKDLLSGSSDSLKAKVESQMTQRIADTIPLHQRIKFIQELFQGDVEQLESLIQYIDNEAEATTWASELMNRYHAYRVAENEAIWEELHTLIERKFN
jgi:ATP-dependent helicase/DNAse subunit B